MFKEIVWIKLSVFCVKFVFDFICVVGGLLNLLCNLLLPLAHQVCLETFLL